MTQVIYYPSKASIRKLRIYLLIAALLCIIPVILHFIGVATSKLILIEMLGSAASIFGLISTRNSRIIVERDRIYLVDGIFKKSIYINDVLDIKLAGGKTIFNCKNGRKKFYAIEQVAIDELSSRIGNKG